MVAKKPKGEDLKKLIEQWRQADHQGKLTLCQEYRVAYKTLKDWVLSGPDLDTEGSTELLPLEKSILQIVSKTKASIGEISRKVDRSRETVVKTLDNLRDKHYAVELDEASQQVSLPEEPSKIFEPTQYRYFRKFYRIGLLSDTHLGSKYQQVTLLHDAYSVFDDRGTDFNLHGGDLTEGLGLYRGQDVEVFLHTAKDEREYVVENYPKSKRRTKTYVIGGQHDRSFYAAGKGYDIVEHICQERTDLIYRGFYKAEFRVKGIPIGLMHPGGGVAYARSYRTQKIIEAIVGALSTIKTIPVPRLVVFGHWHVPFHLPTYMGVDAVSLPCFQRQTPYLEQKGLMPTVGFAIAELWLDGTDAVTSTKVEFFNWNHRVIERDF